MQTKPGLYNARLETERRKKKYGERKELLSVEDMDELHQTLIEFEHEVEHLSHEDKQKIIHKIERMNKLLHKYESDE